MGVDCHDFFTDQCAAVTLNQIALGIDLVGPVDVDVDRAGLVESGQRNSQFDCQLGRGLRSGNATDAQPLAQMNGQLLNEGGSGVSGP